MTSLLLLATLAAAETPDELVYSIVNELYGKEVPHQAVCIERPSVPDEWADEVVVVGVMRGHEGCQVFGTFVDGGWKATEKAARYAISDEVWDGADSATRSAWLTQWTETVLLAFDARAEADGPLTAKRSGTKTTISGRIWRRADTHLASAHTEGSWTFDGRDLVEQQREGGELYRTRFTTGEIRLAGLDGDAIHSAIQSKGQGFKACFVDAWKEDILMDGRLRMSWTLTSGSADKVGVVTGDETGTSAEACYARMIKEVQWPTSLSGSVVWSFNAIRSPIKDQ